MNNFRTSELLKSDNFPLSVSTSLSRDRKTRAEKEGRVAAFRAFHKIYRDLHNETGTGDEMLSSGIIAEKVGSHLDT